MPFMMKPYIRMKRLADDIVSIGVTTEMPTATAKHVRFCNISAASFTLAALLSFIFEAPLIVDWVTFRQKEWVILALRLLASLPFVIPLILNARGHYKVSRIFFMTWGIFFCLFLTLLYGQVGPTHVLLLVVTVVASALFPANERKWMWVSITGAGIALLLCLWLRQQNIPLVPVSRPIIQLVSVFFVTLGAFFTIIMVAMTQRSVIADAEQRLAVEQKKAEDLLLNILPEPIAKRLKASHASIADGFEEVTVMFADLVGFTPLAKELTPVELVDLMDRIFSQFDQLTERYGLEKIKTIGDSYMVAGGLPLPSENHTQAMAKMALDMLTALKTIEAPVGRTLELRIGIARGPAVAGVIGKKKFSYDLWGDTVNTASRLESQGTQGQIHVNEAVWEQLQGNYQLEPCGTVEIRGRGPLKTWFLIGRKA